MRNWLLLVATGIAAALLFHLLPDPWAPSRLEVGLENGRLELSVDGLPRLTEPLAGFASGPWLVEVHSSTSGTEIGAEDSAPPFRARLEEASEGRFGPEFPAGGSLELLPPGKAMCELDTPLGACLVVRPPGEEAGFRITVNPGANILRVQRRLPGDCAVRSLTYLPLRPTTGPRCWSVLARSLAGLVAKACLALAAFLGAAAAVGRFPHARPGPSFGMGGRTLPWAAAATALLISTALFWGPARRIPLSYDDVTLVFQAQIEAQGHLNAPHPPLANFFGAEGLYQSARGWTGKQALFWPWVLGWGLKARLAWLLNPLLAAACVLLLARLGLAAGLGGEALLAAWGLALSPFLLEMSATYLNMVAALAAALWLAGEVWRLGETPEGPAAKPPVRPAAGGLSLAPWLRLAMPLALLTLLRPYTALWLWLGSCVWLLGCPRRSLLRTTALAGAGFALAAALVLGQNLLQTGHPLLSAYEVFAKSDHPGFGPQVGPFNTWGSTGYDLAKLALNLDLYTRLFTRALNGWPWGLALVPLLAGLLWRRPDALDRLLGCLILSQIAAYALYFTADTIHGPRYWMELSGFVVLLQARGCRTLLDRWGNATYVRWLGVAALAALTGGGLFFYGERRAEALLTYNHVDGHLRRAVEELPPAPTLIFFPNEEPNRYVEAFGLQDPWLNGPAVFARDQGSAAADAALAERMPGRKVLYWDGKTLSRTRWAECILPL
jgi:hypothetical protein